MTDTSLPDDSHTGITLPNSSTDAQVASDADIVDEPAAPRSFFARLPRWVWGVAAAAVAAVIVVIVVVTARNPFIDAIEDCGLDTSPYISVRDEGETLLVDTIGEDSSGADFSDTACVIIELEVPDAIVTRMDSTRALDGVQTGEFDGIKAQWSYHPDNGLDIIFTR